MTIELWMLVWSGVLLFVQILVAAQASTHVKGIAWNAGNREDPAPATGWPARATRAYHNMMETLPVFIILVLAAHLANIHTANTVLGAELYLSGRIAHALLYYLGIAYVRTLAWLVSIAGMALILVALIANSPTIY